MAHSSTRSVCEPKQIFESHSHSEEDWKRTFGYTGENGPFPIAAPNRFPQRGRLSLCNTRIWTCSTSSDWKIGHMFAVQKAASLAESSGRKGSFRASYTYKRWSNFLSKRLLSRLAILPIHLHHWGCLKVGRSNGNFSNFFRTRQHLSKEKYGYVFERV